MTEIIYEWVVEELATDGSGDIVDCHYWPEEYLESALVLFGALRRDNKPADFGLCRRKCSDMHGDLERGYAYFAKGEWPPNFDDNHKIPSRFRLPELDMSEVS